MRLYKFNLKVLDDDGNVVLDQDYQTYAQIADKLKISYFTIRDLCQKSEGRKNTYYTQKHIQDLLDKIKITRIKHKIEIDLNKKIYV